MVKKKKTNKNNIKDNIKEIYGYRWLNPWLIVGDSILLIIFINLILIILFKPYMIIANVMNIILLPTQLISYWVLAPKWRNKNIKLFTDWVAKRMEKNGE